MRARAVATLLRLLPDAVSATSHPALAGRLRRLFEWFWLGAQRRSVREGPSGSPRSDELVRRAELALELAERARRPAEPFLHGDGEALACDLYRQAVFWTLFARAPSEGAAAPGSPSFASLWERADPDALTRAAGGADARDELRAVLIDRTFAEFAELGRTERGQLATRLAAFVDRLLDPLRDERRRLARVWKLRFVRLGGLGFVALALALVTSRTLAWQDERRDLSKRASWSASSNATGGCRSPAQECPESPGYFFHTQLEPNPFVVFDLGRQRGLTRVNVENRLDCCPERAVPLVIEVSSDQKQWKQVARRDEAFTTWRAKFPRVRAQFVRLRLNGNGMLHLSRVRILP